MAERVNVVGGQTRPSYGRAVGHGIIGGIIAGIIFAMFEMVVAALMMGADAFWMPLRMIGAMVLGREAMEMTYPLLTAAGAGIIVHMALSTIFGIIFALIATAVPVLLSSPAWLLGAATVYGLLLWLVNFYIIAPIAGWDWFPTQAHPFWQGFVAHTFLYGTALGIYLNAVLGRRRAV